MCSVFPSRYFNRFKCDGSTATKISTNKAKIFEEYNYYRLLPDAMKHYMVEPFKYEETESDARYSMDYIQSPDFAREWLSGKVGLDRFGLLLDECFDYLNNRPVRSVTIMESRSRADNLYRNKVNRRLREYETLLRQDALAALVGCNVDAIMDLLKEAHLRYKELYEIIHKDCLTSVISHGDLCFSNIFLGDRCDADGVVLRFIDPRGARTKDDLWMDPYYDVAKLSHSVLGNYDMFNAGFYEVSPSLELKIKYPFDVVPYCEMFIDYLAKNGYNYKMVRLYESSLFLSMLPLHIDDPLKTVGFAVNASNILKELDDGK